MGSPRPLFTTIEICVPLEAEGTPTNVNGIYAHKEQDWGDLGLNPQRGGRASRLAEETGLPSSHWESQGILADGLHRHLQPSTR